MPRSRLRSHQETVSRLQVRHTPCWNSWMWDRGLSQKSLLIVCNYRTCFVREASFDYVTSPGIKYIQTFIFCLQWLKRTIISQKPCLLSLISCSTRTSAPESQFTIRSHATVIIQGYSLSSNAAATPSRNSPSRKSLVTQFSRHGMGPGYPVAVTGSTWLLAGLRDC